MSRLLTSLTAAATALAEQAATRLDTWVENNTSTDADAPREEPLGFAVPTGERGKGVNAMGLTGEQRARWLAEVKTRLDASTGGPWVTDLDTIISPYGVIATGVTRAADRDLIEDARADLYGLLALAEHDDQAIKLWTKSTADYAARAGEAERELQGMKVRERDVEYVLDHVADGRLTLREYIDPETPAGRVKELVTTLLTQVRDAENGAQVQHLTDDLAAARETIAALERKLDAHHRHDAAAAPAAPDADSPFMPEASASQLVHTIRVALNMYDKGQDPMASLCLRHPLDLSGRVAELASHALRLENADAATDADAVRARAAERIRTAAARYADQVEENPGAHNVPEATAYYAGMRDAATIAADEPAEADPNVAHIDTVNGRAAAADEQPDDMPVVTPGSFLETVLATGGTVVIDDNGDPHVTDIRIGNDPAAIGTLITADGKRHRFTGATASPVDGHVIENGDADHDTALGIGQAIKEHREARERADRDDEAIDG